MCGRSSVAAARRGDAAEPGEEDVSDRTVHRRRHLHRQDRSRGADQGPGDDQRDVVEGEAGRGGGKAGERVQQRDHDRHVGAADREDDEVAEQGGGDQDRDEDALARLAVVDRDVDASGEDPDQQHRVDHLLSRHGQRPGRIRSWSLAKAMFEPQKETEPTTAANSLG